MCRESRKHLFSIRCKEKARSVRPPDGPLPRSQQQDSESRTRSVGGDFCSTWLVEREMLQQCAWRKKCLPVHSYKLHAREAARPHAGVTRSCSLLAQKVKAEHSPGDAATKRCRKLLETRHVRLMVSYRRWSHLFRGAAKPPVLATQQDVCFKQPTCPNPDIWGCTGPTPQGVRLEV